MTAQRYGLCSCYGDRHSSGSVIFFAPFICHKLVLPSKEGSLGLSRCHTSLWLLNQIWVRTRSTLWSRHLLWLWRQKVRPPHGVSQVTLQGGWFCLTPHWPPRTEYPREKSDRVVVDEFFTSMTSSKKCPHCPHWISIAMEIIYQDLVSRYNYTIWVNKPHSNLQVTRILKQNIPIKLQRAPHHRRRSHRLRKCIHSDIDLDWVQFQRQCRRRPCPSGEIWAGRDRSFSLANE